MQSSPSTKRPYRAKFTRDPGEVKSLRLFVIGNAIYRPEEYSQLKDFYQKVNAKDKEPAVLEFKQAASTTGGAQRARLNEAFPRLTACSASALPGCCGAARRSRCESFS